MQDERYVFYRTVLDAIPIMIFIVDEDVRCIDLNRTAETGLALDRARVLNMRGGEALHCLHAHDDPGGCGRGPECKQCIIRNSVKESRQGTAVVRRRTQFEFETAGKTNRMEILVTANAMEFGDRLLTILVLEDMSEMTKLRDIVPICAKCKKVRDDKQYWQSMEQYFADYRGVDFTHGLCPQCLREAYPDYKGEYDHLIGKDKGNETR